MTCLYFHCEKKSGCLHDKIWHLKGFHVCSWPNEQENSFEFCQWEQLRLNGLNLLYGRVTGAVGIITTMWNLKINVHRRSNHSLYFEDFEGHVNNLLSDNQSVIEPARKWRFRRDVNKNNRFWMRRLHVILSFALPQNWVFRYSIFCSYCNSDCGHMHLFVGWNSGSVQLQ